MDDLPFLLEIRNECRGFLHDDRSFTPAESRRWFMEKRPDYYLIRMGGEGIGYFRTGGHDPVAGTIDIGADLHRDFRGRGFARPVYGAFLVFVRERYRVSKVGLEVLSHNTVARALYAKLGFVETARRVGVTVRNGVMVDSIRMERMILPP